MFLLGKARWGMALLLFYVWLGSFNSLISGEQTGDERESRCYSSHPRSIQTSLQLLCFCSCLINQWKHATKCLVFIAPYTKYCNVNTITMRKTIKAFKKTPVLSNWRKIRVLASNMSVPCETQIKVFTEKMSEVRRLCAQLILLAVFFSLLKSMCRASLVTHFLCL